MRNRQDSSEEELKAVVIYDSPSSSIVNSSDSGSGSESDSITSMPHFSTLAVELIFAIARWLALEDIHNMALLNKSFFEKMQDIPIEFDRPIPNNQSPSKIGTYWHLHLFKAQAIRHHEMIEKTRKKRQSHDQDDLEYRINKITDHLTSCTECEEPCNRYFTTILVIGCLITLGATIYHCCTSRSCEAFSCEALNYAAPIVTFLLAARLACSLYPCIEVAALKSDLAKIKKLETASEREKILLSDIPNPTRLAFQ
ncbi:MAG: hypothetical protein KIT56_01425 [Gammaproteobacteria bacterium]|nr:hypothetical protein [Gammaproteobacteria bacterium]MCW5582545.1 hypothetical protein [Gammaproteobacteria bacterium]